MAVKNSYPAKISLQDILLLRNCAIISSKYAIENDLVQNIFLKGSCLHLLLTLHGNV